MFNLPGISGRCHLFHATCYQARIFRPCENPYHATSRRRRMFLISYFYTTRDAGNGRQTVCKRRKTWRKKRQLQWLGFAQTSWKNFDKDWEDSMRILDLSEAQERDESNYKRCSCLSPRGHSRKLAKLPISNRFYQVFDQVGKSFPNYKPGTNWRTKCKEHWKISNKQKAEKILTLISVSSRLQAKTQTNIISRLRPA